MASSLDTHPGRAGWRRPARSRTPGDTHQLPVAEFWNPARVREGRPAVEDRRQGRCALIGCATMTLRRAIVTLAAIAAALAVLRYVTSNRGA